MRQARTTVNPVRICLALIALSIAIAICIGAWNTPHLSFYSSDLNRPMLSIPVETLDGANGRPVGWRDVEFGELHFCLPRSFGSDSSIELTGPNTVRFRNTAEELVFVSLPNASEVRRLIIAELQAAPEGVPRSILTEEAMTFTASASEFHWGMTQNEVQRLKWLLSRKFEDSSIVRVMLRREEDWEGLLIIMSDKASFAWNMNDGSCGATMLFRPAGDELAQQIIEVCQSFKPRLNKQGNGGSLRIDGEVYPLAELRDSQHD